MDANASTSPTDRMPALDVVRGVAVLGILAPNIIGMGQPLVAYNWPAGFLSSPGPLSEWLWAAQLVLIDGKFRGLFTLLFGAGMVLFFARAQQRGQGYGLLARRLGWLGLFGFLHWPLLWRGDILMTYAAAGIIVLPFVGWSWTRQIALGLTGYLVGALAGFASSVPVAAMARGSYADVSTMSEYRDALADAQALDVADARLEAELLRAGDYPGTVRHSLEAHLPTLPNDLLQTLFEAAPLMLIGMGLLGAGLFAGRIIARRQRAWGWAAWFTGTLLTLPIAAWAVGEGIGYWDSYAVLHGWLPLPQLASTAGLIALLALWGVDARGPLALRLGDAGRCAFTNYIGCSALGLAVFSGWGLGLYGELGRLELYGVMIAFWAVMLAWPRWWLARYRHGPLEWLWRCLTYWRRMPLRR